MCKEFQAPSIDGTTGQRKAVYDRAFLSVVKAASKDISRRNLSGVYFDKGRTVATNGHILAMVECPDVSAYPDHKPFIIDGQDLPKVGKKEHLEFAPEDISPEAVRFAITNCNPDNMKIQTARPIDADFPDYRQVMPEGEPEYTIRLDAAYVRTLMDIHLSSEDRTTYVDFAFYGDTAPAIMESETQDGKKITTVCMPVRRG